MSFFSTVLRRLEAPRTRVEIAKNEPVGSHIRKITLKVADPAAAPRYPIGSYVQPMIGGVVPRAYSVVEDTGEGCIIIVSTSGHGAGARFFETVPAGTAIDVYGPFDDFQYRYDTKRPKIFFATGTGVAPFIRMAQEAITEKTPSLLVLGVPEESDIPYYDYFKSLTANTDLFDFFPVLSKPTPEWKGGKGYVTNQFVGNEDYLRRSDIYVCGIPPMVHGVQKMLVTERVPQNQIFVQKFG